MRNFLSALFSIPILLLFREAALSIQYTEQGFFCDDNEIRYPDRAGTFGSHSMHTIYAVIVILAIPLSEFSYLFRYSSSSHPRSSSTKKVLFKSLFFYVCYVCGVLATSVATNVFKRTSSRLRPNFIAVCKPKDLDVLCPLGSNVFITSFICLGESRPDEHFSFPSSHASHSLYFATFVIFYLHRRWRLPSILRAFAQFGVFLLSIFICLSRVRDFKHRYVDVAGGAMLGLTIGISMIHLVLFNFKHHRYQDETTNCRGDEEKRALISSEYGALEGVNQV